MKKTILCMVFQGLLSTAFAQVDSALVMIREVKRQLNEGADFCQMALTYSEDNKTKMRCGEIGIFGKGELMRGYEDAMVALKVGEISDIVKTGYGYHIIQLISTDKKKYNTRHILIKYK